jgi:hypothetical protein
MGPPLYIVPSKIIFKNNFLVKGTGREKRTPADPSEDQVTMKFQNRKLGPLLNLVERTSI